MKQEMIIVEIYCLQDRIDELAGFIKLDDNGELCAIPVDHEYGTLMQNILDHRVVLADRKIDPYTDPQDWIMNLWKVFHGVALRASEPRIFDEPNPLLH